MFRRSFFAGYVIKQNSTIRLHGGAVISYNSWFRREPDIKAIAKTIVDGMGDDMMPNDSIVITALNHL